MRMWVIFAVSVLLPSFVAADPSDTPESRKAAADRYIQVSELRKLILDSVDAMSQTIPSEQRERFRDLMIKHVRPEVLEAAMRASMQKHFTTHELNALADFYGSDVGRAAMSKFGVYMADVMPLMQAELTRAFSEWQREQTSGAPTSGT